MAGGSRGARPRRDSPIGFRNSSRSISPGCVGSRFGRWSTIGGARRYTSCRGLWEDGDDQASSEVAMSVLRRDGQFELRFTSDEADLILQDPLAREFGGHIP